MKQYIYSENVCNLVPQLKVHNYTIFNLTNTWDVIKSLVLIYNIDRSIVNTIKLSIKIICGKSHLYLCTQNGHIASYAIVALGYCNFYDVASQDFVIGTVNTKPSHQGNGLATQVLSSIIKNIKVSNPSATVFIDTSENNIPMQKVIDKLCFGKPKSHYLR